MIFTDECLAMKKQLGGRNSLLGYGKLLFSCTTMLLRMPPDTPQIGWWNMELRMISWWHGLPALLTWTPSKTYGRSSNKKCTLLGNSTTLRMNCGMLWKMLQIMSARIPSGISLVQLITGCYPSFRRSVDISTTETYPEGRTYWDY